ncbi:hypothetical protein [Glycomyces tritici]|uniref:Uncharacterized protein n=1 Tax=Glycomyces tritici TaxID=2665176 RepID=A0ABT7YXR3_9ACTN|nr:hypothetical protein [Glycomyces tritici]MDN3243018.1 hypothetical protein [Glycomyces tritici]
MRKAAVALERIYSAAVSERGFAGDGPTPRPNLDVQITLEQSINRAREQLYLLEALRVRFYHRLVAEADTLKAGWKAVADLGIREDAWQEMQIEDFRRFGPGA